MLDKYGEESRPGDYKLFHAQSYRIYPPHKSLLAANI